MADQTFQMEIDLISHNRLPHIAKALKKAFRQQCCSNPWDTQSSLRAAEEGFDSIPSHHKKNTKTLDCQVEGFRMLDQNDTRLTIG